VSRRVVLLSPGGTFVADVLALLHQRGVRADALVLYARGSALAEWRPMRGVRRAANLPLIPLRWAVREMRRRWRMRHRGGAAPVVFTGPLNGRRMEADLRRLAPDVVVLAHCGLVAPHILSIPSEGVVNVHPGLLPWIRGNSTFGNSLLRGVPLGCTAFRVDAGIDTGRILARRLVPVRGGETLAALRDAMIGLWVEMTADVIATAQAGPLPPGEPQPGRFPLCPTLATAEERAPVDAAVLRGDAKTLFDRWLPLCAPTDLTLPVNADLVPHAIDG
jgi:hypothetical protein